MGLLAAPLLNETFPSTRNPTVIYFGRYFVMPVASAAILAWSGIQFAAGYAVSVLAKE